MVQAAGLNQHRNGNGGYMNTAVDEARKLIETLPETATWDDIMYELYVKQKLRSALDAEKKGRVLPHEDVKKRLTGK